MSMTSEEVDQAIQVLKASYNDTAKINVDLGKVVLGQENQRLEAENKAMRQFIADERDHAHQNDFLCGSEHSELTKNRFDEFMSAENKTLKGSLAWYEDKEAPRLMQENKALRKSVQELRQAIKNHKEMTLYEFGFY